MTKLMQTGITGLDRVLCGGFLYHNSILLKGAPGCGKTTLGMQIVFNGATRFKEPGVIVLFEQFPQQLFRDLMSYGWEIHKLEAEGKLRIIFSEPEQVISCDKTIDPPLLGQIQNAAAEIGAKRILVDSVSHILNLSEDRRHAREILLRFINSLKSAGLTPILTAEAETREGEIGVDEYLTDCVLNLSSQAAKTRAFQIRQITVRKTRGHEHLRGQHVFKLSEKGVEVFPRAYGEPEAGTSHDEAEVTRVTSGVAGLDHLLGGGFTRATTTTIAGMPGTYKTTMGAQFLRSGAEEGEPGLFLTFAERPSLLVRFMQNKGVPLQAHVDTGMLKIWHYVPRETYIEEILARLEQEFRQNGTRRLVVDSINELEHGIEDPDTYKDVLQSLLSLCHAWGVTTVITQKLDQLSNNPLSNIRYASMFDGIVYLGILEIESSMHKVISVLKMRGGDYDSDLRELICGKDGLYVHHKFLGLSGILSGNTQGQYKKTVEEVFQPLYVMRDFLAMIDSEETSAEQKQMLVTTVRGEVDKLVEKLKTHFDIEDKV